MRKLSPALVSPANKPSNTISGLFGFVSPDKPVWINPSSLTLSVIGGNSEVGLISKVVPLKLGSAGLLSGWAWRNHKNWIFYSSNFASLC